MSNISINEDVRNLLARAAIATAKTASEAAKLNEKRVGAYTLYIQAGIAAKDANVLEVASDALFEEIRTTGKVTDGKGRATAIGAKPNKDATGFVVPSAISAAKSYVLDAMSRCLSLVDEAGEARSFSDVRKEVMAAKETERRATAEGDEAVRIRALDLLAILADHAREAKGATLAAIVAGAEAALGSVIKAKGATATDAKGTTLARAA